MKSNFRGLLCSAALAWLPEVAQAIMVTTTFNDLSENNNANNLINSPYQSGDFNFAAGNLFFRGTRSVYYPGSGALYTGDGGSQPMTITRDGGLAFNFYAADVAERENAAATASFLGTRADGSTVSSTIRLDGGNSTSQNFGFAGFTNIVSLRFSGGDQLDRIVFSNLVPPPASDATVHFDDATPGTVGASYSENGYQLSSSAPGGMGIQSTMNDSHGLGVAGAGTIDLTKAGELFNLQGFDIHSQLGEFGLFCLIVTDEFGTQHTSSSFSLGSYDETELLQMFGGQAFANQITIARFENTTGQGIVLDNIYAIPEPFECGTTTEDGTNLRNGLFRDRTLIAIEGLNVPSEAETLSGFNGGGFTLNDFSEMAFLSRVNGGGRCLLVHGAGGLHNVAKTGDTFLESTITDIDFARIVEKLLDGFRVRFPRISGRDYVMERDEDLLAPWEVRPTPVKAGPDGRIIFDDLGPGLPARRFYRCAEAP